MADSQLPIAFNKVRLAEFEFEQCLLETSKKNVKLLEQLFRCHSMIAQMAGDQAQVLKHLRMAGFFMKASLKTTFDRYTQLLKDKMEQPAEITMSHEKSIYL